MADDPSTQKVIENISMGIIQGKVAWVLHYQGGGQESFSLHTPVARQFMQGLQELVLLLEHQEAQTAQDRGAAHVDGLSMSDTATVRLSDPSPQED
jgi:hypothetical protein